MSLSSIDSKIVAYLPQLGANEKKSILEVIKSFVKLKGLDEDVSVSLEEYNQELHDALKRVKSGQFTSQETLENEMELW
jgi:hypothetical protein